MGIVVATQDIEYEVKALWAAHIVGMRQGFQHKKTMQSLHHM